MGHLIRASLALGCSVALALAVHAPAATPRAKLELVDGTLSMSNSKAGTAILSAHDMRPGVPATGTVTIANTGSARGWFALSSFDITDTPGLGGGLLSTALAATILDVTDPSSPRAVYSGPLGAMTSRTLGAFEPGTQHTFSFSVGLPAGGGAALDAVQGGAVTVGYRWDATTEPPPEPPTPTTTTDPPPATDPPTTGNPPTTGPPPTTTPLPPKSITQPPPLKLTLKGPSTWSVRKRGGPSVTALCTRACTLRVAVKVRGASPNVKLKVRSKPMASAAGRGVRLAIVTNPKALAALRRAVGARKKVSIEVAVRATDQAKVTVKGTKLIRVTR